MSRRTHLIKRTAWLAGVLTLAACAAPANRSTSSSTASQTVASKNTLTVLQLNPKQANPDDTDASQQSMYGYPILDRVEVTDPAVIHEVMTLLERGFAAQDVERARCFLPRHGVVHTTDRGSTEYVICFQCNWYFARGPHSSAGRGTTSSVAKPMLDRLLRGDKPQDVKVVGIPPEVLEQLMQEGKVVLIDVREQDEYAAERIPGAHHVALSSFDPEAVRRAFEGKRVVFHCKAGGRSAIAVKRFYAAKAVSIHLKGGIEAWKASGRATVSD